MFWRSAFKKAVNSAWEVSRAEARVTAVLGGKFTIVASEAVQRLDGTSAAIDVTYPKVGEGGGAMRVAKRWGGRGGRGGAGGGCNGRAQVLPPRP